MRHLRAVALQFYRLHSPCAPWLAGAAPKPHRFYSPQARGCILVSSSPEILCRMDGERTITNRPLAGTRRRGDTPAQVRSSAGATVAA